VDVIKRIQEKRKYKYAICVVDGHSSHKYTTIDKAEELNVTLRELPPSSSPLNSIEAGKFHHNLDNGL